MATIAVVPVVMRQALLQVATDNYEKHVEQAQLTPSVKAARFKGIDGSVATDSSIPEWTLELSFAQDWSTASSLSQYLLTNAGLQKTVVLSPYGSTTGKPKYTIDVIVQPGPIGGKVDEMMLGNVSLPCIGQPVRTTWP